MIGGAVKILTHTKKKVFLLKINPQATGSSLTSSLINIPLKVFFIICNLYFCGSVKFKWLLKGHDDVLGHLFPPELD